MRGASGDAARRDKDRAAGPSNAAFEDYIKFEDMFGASSIFTTGTARQKQREREAYVKDVMERKLYGYVHRLETHGAPIQRVTIGGGCEAPENADGFALAAAREAATARAAAAEATPARDGRGKKRARMSAAHGGGGARAATPHRAAPRAIAPWGASPGAIPDLSVARFHANDASLANVFEATQDDWEQDSLWAAMEEAVGNPGFRGGVHGSFAEDPASILPPLSALKPAAPPQEALAAHEPAPRERFERIEVRARDARRAAPPPPRSNDPPPTLLLSAREPPAVRRRTCCFERVDRPARGGRRMFLRPEKKKKNRRLVLTLPLTPPLTTRSASTTSKPGSPPLRTPRA